jgi:hypothetical protein
MLHFAAHILLIPDTFHGMTAVGEKTGAAQVYLLMLGLREFLVALIALAIAVQGSDELCRTAVTLTFVILSPVQTYTMATSSSIQDDVRTQIVVLQTFFAIYLSLSVLNSWLPPPATK